jgi:lipid A 3-O-deacylase
MKKLAGLTGLVFLFAFCKGQESDTLFKNDSRLATFAYDNDLFYGTDRYYSQGVLLDISVPGLSALPLSKILVRLNSQANNYYWAGLEQDCFTPKSILLDTVNRTDRPFCGLLYLSRKLVSMNHLKKRRLTTEIDLGVIGPAAGCEQTQKTIHRFTNNDEPHGWQFQLKNDLLLNYSALLEQGLIVTKYFEAVVSAEAKAGTVYDQAGVGILIRTGKMNGYFQNIGLDRSSKKFQFFIKAGGKASFVAYNGTMQGGLFTQSAHEVAAAQIQKLVYSYNAGAVMAYKRISLEYSQTFISPEITNGLDHGWGRCALMWAF